MPGSFDEAAQRVANTFAMLPGVVAVALAGSQTTGQADDLSDLDLYVYATDKIPTASRREVAARMAAGRVEIDNRFWEPGDEWREARSGLLVDIMFRSPGWIEEQLARLLDEHQASVGYTTCFWYNVRNSQPLYDQFGWYARVQERANVDYPEALREAIVAKNHPILRDNHSAYMHQIEKAVARRDPMAVNHRMTALLASYFDILFALNRTLHPGEKRLLEHAARLEHIPTDMVNRIETMLAGAASSMPGQHLLRNIDVLLDGLDDLLERESLLPVPEKGIEGQ